MSKQATHKTDDRQHGPGWVYVSCHGQDGPRTMVMPADAVDVPPGVRIFEFKDEAIAAAHRAVLDPDLPTPTGSQP